MINLVQITANKRISVIKFIRFSKTYQFLISGFLLFAISNVSAQDTLILSINSIDKSQTFINENIEIDTVFTQLPILQIALNNLITELQSTAYLTASVDSISKVGNRVEAFVFVGEKYRWAKLTNGNIDEIFLSKIGFREKLYQNKPFDYSQVVKLKNALLDYCENNGFPFASVKLSEIRIEKDQIAAIISLNKGPLILINSIVPFLFLYGKGQDKPELCDRALLFLEKMKPEKNTILEKWKRIGQDSANAGESQALLELYNEYCSAKKCLICGIGNKLLRQ